MPNYSKQGKIVFLIIALCVSIYASQELLQYQYRVGSTWPQNSLKFQLSMIGFCLSFTLFLTSGILLILQLYEFLRGVTPNA